MFEVAVFLRTHGWTIFHRRRWTRNPAGIRGISIFSAMFTRILPRRSGPLTPHVNCFHSVSETDERTMWVCLPFFISFFFFLPKLYLQECNCTPSVHSFPWGPKHTDPQTHSGTVREGETVATFKFPTADIWARHDKTLFFVSPSLFVIWRPGFLETSIEFISCACWGNTQNFSSLEEVEQAHDTEVCAPMENIRKNPPKLVRSAGCLWSGEKYPAGPEGRRVTKSLTFNGERNN